MLTIVGTELGGNVDRVVAAGSDFSEPVSDHSTPYGTINKDCKVAPSSSTPCSSGFGSYADFQSQAELYPSNRVPFPQDIEKCMVAKKVEQSEKYTGIKRYGGLLLTLLASFCFSFVTLFVKSLSVSYGVDAYGSSFWRYVGITIPALPVLMLYECGPLKSKIKNDSVFQSISPFRDNWKTFLGLLARGIVGSTSVILRYYALQYLTIGDTSVITYSTPVLVTIMAHFILGERCGVVPVIVAFTTLIGVVIVTKPPLLTGAESFDSNTLIGTGLAVASLFCASLIVIMTRMIREVHYALMVLVFGSIGLLQSTIMACSFGHIYVPQDLASSLLSFGVASLSFFGQISIVLALKFENAGPVALLRSCDVVLGFILQFIFMGEIPDIYSLIGGIIVFTGIMIVASRKWVKTLPAESYGKKFFGWVLF